MTGIITIAGYPGDPISTDPSSGFYSVTLAEDHVYTLTVTSLGYVTAVRTVGPLTANRTENFALQVDLNKCMAPGYTLYGVSESFDAAGIPTGWAIINNVGTLGWSFNDPGGRGNLTGGTGNFGIADSDDAGSVAMDTELRSPVMNLSTLSAVTLTFKTDFNSYSTEIADVDVSTNGAAGPWTNVWRKSGADYRGPKTEAVNLTAIAGGQANVMLRFHYYDANYEWWWQVDDVQLGQCKLQTTVNLPALTPATAAQAGYPGTVVTYTLNLSNTDSVSHTFDVLIDHNNWPTNAATSIGPVAAQAVQPFTVAVAIPGNAVAHSTDAAIITVRAQDSQVLSDTAILTTTATFVPGITLEPAQLVRTAEAGEWVTHTLNLTNTGNFTDTFAVDYSGHHWELQGSLSVTLAAWTGTPLSVTVHVPLTATTGLSDTAHLTVTGTGVFAFSDLITTASRLYAVYLPLILK